MRDSKFGQDHITFFTQPRWRISKLGNNSLLFEITGDK